jgi:peptidoglycan/xylan/chitin deacetylase (PgdA/CDA1 family)
MLLSQVYYALKFIIPRPLQIRLRRYFIQQKRLKYADIWPIDKNAGKQPDKWSGWPEGKKFALVLTHDVERAERLDKCQILAEIEEHRGFRSSFNFVVDDYQIPRKLRQYLIDHGFEIGIHGLTHDQNPFRSRSTFKKNAVKINEYLDGWGSVGFRSPSMYHDLELLHYLNIEYDASTFDTDPFEPQPDGMGTIFPFWVGDGSQKKGYVELPYTVPQDFLLYILMKEQNIDIWKKKLDWIADHGGMALFIAHPTYMNFDKHPSYEEYPARRYVEFLEYIEAQYKGQYWHILPREMAHWWKVNMYNRFLPE